MESGESFSQWQKRVAAGEIPRDLPPHRIENIFRTNLQGHYARGRCEQQKRVAESHPWYLYDAVNDSRTRPSSHAAMEWLHGAACKYRPAQPRGVLGIGPADAAGASRLGDRAAITDA